jgi:hypothetical protein
MNSPAFVQKARIRLIRKRIVVDNNGNNRMAGWRI